jgi:uracil phosphoribosyltransferase
MHPRLTVVDHPLAARHLAVLRDRSTPSPTFRAVLSDVSMLLLYEALRDLRVDDTTVETPLEPAPARRLADDIVVVAIMRAGLGMVDGALRLVPEARVGHLGVYRDEEALRPVNYYESLPPGLGGSEVVVVDPMLATGGSAVHALDVVKRSGPARVRLVCLVAAPEGLEALAKAHPDVPVTVAAVDDHLDERGYIRPGLGDAGDRLFGTTED